jgi:hypothetical protein
VPSSISLRRLYQTDEKIVHTLAHVRRGLVSEHAGEPVQLAAIGAGRFYVLDGAHRVVEAILDGRRSVPAEVVIYSYGVPRDLQRFVDGLSDPAAWTFGRRVKLPSGSLQTLPGPEAWPWRRRAPV